MSRHPGKSESREEVGRINESADHLLGPIDTGSCEVFAGNQGHRLGVKDSLVVVSGCEGAAFGDNNSVLLPSAEVTGAQVWVNEVD